MKVNEKNVARQLLQSLGKPRAEVSDLKAICRDYGYEVIEYGSPTSLELMDSMGLERYTEKGRALTVCWGSIHLVFVDSAMSENEKRLALAHELGHIISGHLFDPGEKDYNVEQEYEANEFAHYMLNPSPNLRALIWLRRRWKILAAVLAAVLIGFLIWENADIGYYVTKSGTKYHKRNCEYVRDRGNVKRIFDISGYEPCSACIKGE